MNRKIIILLITGIFLISGVLSSGATTLKTIKKTSNNGEVDFIITNCCAWCSPAPNEPDLDYMSFKITIENIGDAYEGEGHIYQYTTYYYPDGSTEETEGIITAPSWNVGFIAGSGYNNLEEVKPIEIKVELETDLPESNTETMN